MLKRDSIGFGLLIGIVLPAILFAVLFLAGRYTEPGTLLNRPFQGFRPILLSLVVNLVTMRIYFVNLKMDRTGRGILLGTVIIAAAFFLFFSHL